MLPTAAADFDGERSRSRVWARRRSSATFRGFVNDVGGQVVRGQIGSGFLDPLLDARYNPVTTP